jgi:hypothetical protein
MEESDMYKVLINLIKAGSYELADILGKIDTLWMQGSLTDVERLDLIEMARTQADPSHSFAPLQAQIDALAERIAKLEGATEEEGYPNYVQPTGGHDAYHTGDKVTFQGQKYVCVAPEGVAVVWSPEVYPSYWEAVA